MTNKHLLVFLFIALFTASLQAQNQPRLADKIVAQVNDHIILKSEIDRAVADYIQRAQFQGQSVEFSKEFWYTFLESTVNNYVLLEQAKIDSITVTDEQVNQSMDQRVQGLIQQAGSEQALEEAFGKSIIQIKADFREDFREQMITAQVRQQKINSVKITRPEVRDFFESIPADSLPTIPEQVALSQIVILPPAKENAKQAARDFAEQLRDSIITHGKSIEELARRHSDGPSASNGGLLGLISLNDLVAEYSAAASALKPGAISKVVETKFGFHVIRLNKRVGDKISTNHILIEVDSKQLDNEYAINRLNEIRDTLINNPDLKFERLAKMHSEDPETANSGGKLTDPETGERLIPLNRLDPALYRIVLLMDEVGQISEPKPFNPNNANSGKAYRIVRLDKRVPEHVANFKTDYERIKNIALQQKQMRVYNKWLQEIRDDFYIEYRIPVPNMNAESNL